jgi:hypothetical protein
MVACMSGNEVQLQKQRLEPSGFWHVRVLTFPEELRLDNELWHVGGWIP